MNQRFTHRHNLLAALLGAAAALIACCLNAAPARAQESDSTLVAAVPAIVLESGSTFVAASAATAAKKPVLAVSTNLLYDVAITPNFALEVPLGRRWSIYGEYTFPWWVTKGNDRAWEILKWDLGTRVWLSGRSSEAGALTGHFLGLDLGGGYYDIEPDNAGWQGEALLAGVEYGYAWRLGKNGNWRLDALLGFGWMGTGYRYYEGTDDSAHLLYKYTGRFNWLGPTKAGVALKYVFCQRQKGRAAK